MRALLIQHGCEAALEVLPADMEAQIKSELIKKAHSAVILCLGNKVLREVTRETTVAGVWSKLKTLYMTKSLANKLYQKKKLYTFYMPAGRKISEHIDEFNKIVLDLANIEVKFVDEDLALLLLISLPASYEYFVDTLLYGQEALTLEYVMAILNSKEIKERSKAKGDDGEGLYVRGRTDRRDSHQLRGKSRSKSRGSVRSEVLKGEATTERCVKFCVTQFQSSKVNVINGSRVILFGIQRDNCVNSLDGHAIAGDLNASVQEKDSLAQVWHKRLGHISETGLQVLKKEGLFGKKNLGSDDYVHSDLWGPSQVESLREATCTVTYLINKSPSRAIEKKKPMKMWSGHPSDYGMLRIFGCVAYPHDKQGYKSVEELQVEVELQSLNNHMPEEDQTDQEDGDDEDEGDQVTDSHLISQIITEEEDTHEPLTYQEAVACKDSSKWKAAIKEEMDSLRKNKTWELVDHPAGLVAHGFTQRAGIDYNEVFSLVVRHTSFRVILALTACKDYELEQLDVKATFLHGNLEEVIYIGQPPGYEQGNKVCLLKKSLYGLKQSPRQWYKRFNEYMFSNGFKRSSYDICVYYRSYAPGDYIYLLLYVDDMLIACKSKVEIGSTKSLLKKKFNMKEVGKGNKILGMKIVRDRSRNIMRVSQSGYVSKILNNFRIDNGKSVKMPLGGHFKLSLKDCLVRDCDVERMSKMPYKNAVGSLMYLMVCTRPDISYAVSVVSRYLANPRKNHWEAVKWILKYLRGIANVGFVYGKNYGNHVDVIGFVDSDYAEDPDKEAEYMSLTEAVKEAIWLRGLLEELGVELNNVAVNCDNQDAIHLSRTHVFHERTKHINVSYHFIKEVLEAKTVKVLKVGTKHNAADALTKVVPGLKLQHCLELLNHTSFIKTFDVERLVNNLCTIWIGKHNLHANIARFNRPPLNKGGYSSKVKANSKSALVVNSNRNGIFGPHNFYIQVAKAATYSHSEVKVSKPALVLDESCLHEHDLALSLIDEGAPHFYKKRLCVKTTIQDIIFDSIKIIVKGKLFWICVKELTRWAPNFKDMHDEESDSDAESVDSKIHNFPKDELSEIESETKEIPETVFDEAKHAEFKSSTSDEIHKKAHKDDISEDSFNIYAILNKEKPATSVVQHTKGEPQYPPGFTPYDRSKVNSNLEQCSLGGVNQEKGSPRKENASMASHKESVNASGCSGSFQKDTKMEHVDIFNNLSFDYVVRPSMGSSGGILCVWDSNMFLKENSTVSDYFIAIMGTWLPNNKSMLIISVYAPQELAEKKMLWNYLNLVINRWKGDVIVMGDFNEVRSEDERYGFIFNARGVAAFNSFISAGGLMEVPAGGYSFTWSHKSASKMSRFDRFLVSKNLQRWCPNISSVILDRYVSDHRPIILRELSIDYGPTPFRFFHNSFDLVGFESFVADAWCNISITESNAMFRMALKLKILKGLIQKMESIELAQKAKVKWFIEGDENSKFFHGIINKRRNNLAIRGIVVDGVWIEDPIVVKNEFLSHFQNMFNAPHEDRFVLDMDLPNRLSLDQAQDLENVFSKEEIKGAAWDCGLDKSPGPDGYTLGFYHRFWSLIESEVVDAVNHFFIMVSATKEVILLSFL
nr:retrovirus-related Pol polyprotein from transposon TNT 1-94 [Tanacetum cinerariifolium]